MYIKQILSVKQRTKEQMSMTHPIGLTLRLGLLQRQLQLSLVSPLLLRRLLMLLLAQHQRQLYLQLLLIVVRRADRLQVSRERLTAARGGSGGMRVGVRGASARVRGGRARRTRRVRHLVVAGDAHGVLVNALVRSCLRRSSSRSRLTSCLAFSRTL